MIIWISGNSGKGKTTLARKFLRPGVIHLDGDQIRSSMNKDLGFSDEDRVENNLRVARLAKLLSDQGHTVVVSVIAPFKDLRVRIDKICSPVWIYLDCDKGTKERPYEPPNSGELEFNIMI